MMFAELLTGLSDWELALYLRKQHARLKRARRARAWAMVRAERDGAPHDEKKLEHLNQEIADAFRRQRAIEKEMNRRA